MCHLQNGDVEECQGQLRQLCIAVLHTNAGLRLRSVHLLLSSQPDSNYTISLTPLKITMYYGWTYITTVTSFLLLLYSTITFSAVSKRMSYDGDDSFGTGNMRAI